MGLIIPNRMNETPAFACTICPAEFYATERQQFERHVLSHPPEEIQPHSPAMQAPGIFDPYHESGDVAWQKWIDRKNAEDPHGWAKWMRTDG
jgi:hypothetical protein